MICKNHLLVAGNWQLSHMPQSGFKGNQIEPICLLPGFVCEKKTLGLITPFDLSKVVIQYQQVTIELMILLSYFLLFTSLHSLAI